MSEMNEPHLMKIGQPPGTLIHIGEQKTKELRVQLLEYEDDTITIDKNSAMLSEFANATQTSGITWIALVGLHDVAMIQAIGEKFAVHHLLLEDLLNTEQRPKAETSEGKYFCLLKSIIWNSDTSKFEVEQISIILGDSFVLTFQEKESALFAGVRNRILNGNGRIRKAGADYLAYALIDAVVDQYFLVLEEISDDIEALEEEISLSPTPKTLPRIQNLKRQLLAMRKAIWPLREVLGRLQRGDVEHFRAETLIYIRDVYEHAVQVLDSIESMREVVTGLIDIYLSTIGHRANEVMKVLTIVATIFIPLTFVTSLYGMNFAHIPELAWRWGYLFVWLLMLLLSGIMLFYFRRKKWL